MRRYPALFVALASLSAASVGLAQTPSRPDRPGPGGFEARMKANAQQRTDNLRTILRLTPSQEPALAAYVAAQTPRLPPPLAAPGPPPATTPERLDEMARREAMRSADIQRHRDAVATFYAALTPEQRPVFDALMNLRAPPRPEGPGGRGPEPDGPPPPR